MAVIYLGIGSNEGRREHNCLRSIELLRDKGIEIRDLSSFYETEPWGVEDQPKFINMAISGRTALSPWELLDLLKKTERRMGRQPGDKWGPRLIDIDILLYDDVIFNDAELTIPHPLLHERAFVLLPLKEIASSVIHPILMKSIGEILDQFHDEKRF